MTNKVVLIYDDFNSRFPQNQNIIGTITTQFGNPAPRNGCKIIEIYEYEKEDNHQPNTKPRLKIANNVDVSKLFSASIRCGSTYNYELTLETHSNNTFPTIRATPNFVVIVEPICEKKRTIEYKMMPNGDIRAFQAQASDKRGANGESIYDPKNIAPTIIADGKINIILYGKD